MKESAQNDIQERDFLHRQVTRRGFLKGSGIALVGVAALACNVAEDVSTPTSEETILTPIPTESSSTQGRIVSTPVAEVVATAEVEEQLTPAERLTAFAHEVLLPQYHPVDPLILSEKILPELEQKEYLVKLAINEVEIIFQYYESLKGAKYNSDGLPLDLDILVAVINLPSSQVEDDTALDTMKQYFVTPSPGEVTPWNKFTTQGFDVKEIVWDNPDGTMGSSFTYRFGKSTPNGNGNSYFGACKIFPDSPLIENRSCFPQESSN